MGWDINNCMKFYLNVNIVSEKSSVNSFEELKVIVNKWYQKAP